MRLLKEEHRTYQVRQGVMEKGKGGKRAGQAKATPAGTLIVHDGQECQVPIEELGNWDGRGIGSDVQDLQWKEGCCS